MHIGSKHNLKEYKAYKLEWKNKIQVDEQQQQQILSPKILGSANHSEWSDQIYVGHQPTATLLFSGLGSAVNKIYDTKQSHSPQAELNKFKWMNRCI